MCHFLTGDGDSAALYDQAAARRQGAMESVLWDAERGAWFDYNLMTHAKHSEFYPSNMAPVWAQCYSRPEMGEKAVQYLKVGGTSVYVEEKRNLVFIFLRVSSSR